MVVVSVNNLYCHLFNCVADKAEVTKYGLNCFRCSDDYIRKLMNLILAVEQDSICDASDALLCTIEDVLKNYISSACSSRDISMGCDIEIEDITLTLGREIPTIIPII